MNFTLAIPTRRELKQTLIDSLNLSVCPEEISDDELLVRGKFNLDSLDVLQIAFAMERTYDVEIPDQELTQVCTSVSTLHEYVITRIKEHRLELESVDTSS